VEETGVNLNLEMKTTEYTEHTEGRQDGGVIDESRRINPASGFIG
jgi:hypothetical protein